ncbi:signal peptidase I [Flavobacterium sp. DG1-102-2]|uniref:signal peptidase I n=1 Tax=Flavobacterium sp. DG1-102-2 TaxID=3081663 RepID=UPI002949968F|nr:signal peptidase I [Flavobacterium sp. DG1-102-2]MDV6170189.1 signal peptidase I [Flavobacterium sp. DG1-102-2]
MTLLQWFIFFLAVQVVHFLGTWKLYEKAGRKPWEAAVPVYNAIVLMQIIRKPRWWTILLFVPIVNLIMFPVVWVQTLQVFGKRSATDTILGIVTLGFYVYYINYTGNAQYDPEREVKDSTLSSLLFAIVVATIVHTYVIQPFTIPTSSLEKTLLVGDFLFVSKFNYGARTPMTTVAAPMVHDTIPFINKKSYSNWPQLPYFRFPGFEKVAKNDIVVFNWPADTVTKFFDRSAVGLRKPVDKKSNYVKRCVATPGDIFSIKDGFVYINGKELKLSDRAKPQYNHTIYSKNGISGQILKDNGSTEFNRSYILSNVTSQQQLDALRPFMAAYPSQNADATITFIANQNGLPANVTAGMGITAQEVLLNTIEANLTLKGAENIRHTTGVDSVVRFIERQPTKSVFPYTKDWNQDNMGPFTIPAEGQTVHLTTENLPFYKKIIGEYEKNDLKVIGSEIRINGQVATSYTFKQDYYWMMGDNRHRSEDSRYWGFVPEDHIVGKPVFIWMSLDQNESWKNIGKKIRWERLFTTVGGSGEPVSYFKFFLVALALWFAGSYFWKKKKAKETV